MHETLSNRAACRATGLTVLGEPERRARARPSHQTRGRPSEGRYVFKLTLLALNDLFQADELGILFLLRFAIGLLAMSPPHHR